MTFIETTQIVFYLMMALLKYTHLGGAVCTDCYVTHLDDFDNLHVSDFQLWFRKSPNIGVCFRLCDSDSLCVSFEFNDGTLGCYGYRSSFTLPSRVTTSAESGTKLYLTCKGVHHFGAACSDTADCHDVDNGCIDGRCQCKKDYRLSTNTWSCFKYYIGCYADRGIRMLEFVHQVFPLMTIDKCVDHCRTNEYIYAGLQYTNNCFCGDAIKPEYAKYDDTVCSMPCAGNATQMCGAGWTNSIYTTQQ